MVFVLTLHLIVKRIKVKVPNLALDAWYLNDGTLVGSSQDLSAALHIVESINPSTSLHINRGKFLLFIPNTCGSSLSLLPSEVPVVRDGSCLLGCPISPFSYCDEVS